MRYPLIDYIVYVILCHVLAYSMGVITTTSLDVREWSPMVRLVLAVVVGILMIFGLIVLVAIYIKPKDNER